MEKKIKHIVLNAGADLCGIAARDRFADAPAGFHPTDIMPSCNAVVVFAKRMPAGLARVDPRIVYNRFNDLNTLEVDRIAFQAALDMEELGICATPVPCDNPYDSWDAEKMEGRGTLSMRHAAVLAGLGSFGKSSLVLNKRFGNIMTIGAILTDAALASDELAENICIPSCRRCLDACPTQALGGESVKQMKCRPHTYTSHPRGFGLVNCNHCRTMCPLAVGKRA